ncbi:MAG: adenosylcobinamide-GDP ribazoletransferase [Akkermansia sp.]
MIKRELNLFFNALLFYTRIRVPQSVVCNEQTLSAAFRYLPLVGLLVAGIGAGAYALLAHVLPREVCVMACMVLSILLTGAFHEDGLADFFDGFGAGYDKESILRIMKDSHIGTYGVIALILGLGLKYQLLISLPEAWVVPALITAGAVSRFFPVLSVRLFRYARVENSKAAHSALGVSKTTLFIAALLSLPLCFYFGWLVAVLIIVLELMCCLLLNAYTRRWIGGYTGDCLGAMQQFLELLFYLILLSLPALSQLHDTLSSTH